MIRTRLEIVGLVFAACGLFVAGCGKTSVPGSITGTQGKTTTPSPAVHDYLGECDRNGSPFGAGDGSSSHPYQICHPLQLANISTSGTPPASYRLVTDLDLSGTSVFPAESLLGSFDGEGHTLSHYDGIGPLFVYLAGTVQHLKLEEATINGGTRAGVLAGWVGPSGKVLDCQVSGTVSASFLTGGLVGQNDGQIAASSAQVAMDAYDHVGGLVGVNRGLITGSFATGKVGGGGDYIGGLVGQQTQGGSIMHSYATGEVSGRYQVGGLAGENNPGAINISYATGRVTGVANVGGLVGFSNSTGTTPSTIANAFASGAVTAQFQFGGLVGLNAASLTNAYAVGVVGAGGGGLVGTDGGGTVTGGYWDAIATGVSTSAGGSSQVTAAMQDPATFTGWDFAAIWVSAPGAYPVLR